MDQTYHNYPRPKLFYCLRKQYYVENSKYFEVGCVIISINLCFYRYSLAYSNSVLILAQLCQNIRRPLYTIREFRENSIMSKSACLEGVILLLRRRRSRLWNIHV